MKTFLPLLFFLSFYNNLFSQYPCGNAGDEPPGCTLCSPSYSGYNTGATPGAPGPTSICGPVENNIWLSLVASSTSFRYVFSAGNCRDGKGLEAVVYDMALNPVSPCAISNGGLLAVTVSGLTPGETYLIMIDGIDGDECYFQLLVTDGIDLQPAGQTPDIQGASIGCVGETGIYSLSGSQSNKYYEWSVPPGARIVNGQGSSQITVRFNTSGAGIISCTESTPCAIGTPSFFPVSFPSISPTILPPQVYCMEHFPITIDGLVFNEPTILNHTWTSVDGCDSMVTYTLLAYPNNAEFLLNTICLGDTLNINNQNYFETGNYQQVLYNATYAGCDSVINISLTVVDPQVTIENPDELDCTPNATVTLNAVGNNLPNSGVQYNWVASNGGHILSGSDSPQPVVDAAGTYTVTVEVTINNLPCSQQASVDVFSNGAPGLPIIDTATNFLCRGDTGFYSIEPLLDADTVFWYFDSLDTLAITIDTGFHYAWPAEGGKYWLRIQGKNECGFGPVTDTLIEILPLNRPEFFNFSGDTICLFDTILYSWNPLYSGSDTVIWNVPGGNVTDLPGDNFSIHWANPGIKYPSVILQNGSCFSAIFRDTVFVDPPAPTPIITCSAQTDQVTFDWSVPPGVTGQQVNLISGRTGLFLGNSYQVTGLNPGDEVTIEVVFEGNSTCGPSRDTAVCIAQNCPPIIVSIEPVPTICLDNFNGPLQLNFTTTGGTGNGIATWSGPGITDPSGIFFPSFAGPGSHTILLVYEENGCTYDTTATIELVMAPIADFSYNPAVCLLDNVIVDFTGIASPQATFNWNFGGAQIISGSGTGPFELQFISAGNKIVTLEIQDGGCLSNLATGTIQVFDALSAPVITCQSSSPSDILFTWNNVTGASGYVVNVLTAGITGTQSGNSITINGLLPETAVEIEVTAISNNLCPSTSSRLTCISQGCPPVNISISPITPICEGSNDLITLSATISPFNNGNLTWSGNGVSPTGILDPGGLASGQQTVMLSYEEGPCVFQSSLTYDILPAPIVTDSIQQPIFYGLGGTSNIDLEVQGNGPYTFIWNDGGTTEDRPNLAAGIYCATVEDDNGCATENCYVAGGGIYRVSPIHIICKGDGKRLSVRPNRGADFSWSPATGLSCTDCADPVASPNQSTIYTLTITLPDGRSDSLDIFILVIPPPFCPNAKEIELQEVSLAQQWEQLNAEEKSLPVLEASIHKAKFEKGISIFPNPTAGLVQIQSGEMITSVEIYDVLGRLLVQKVGHSNTLEMNISSLVGGRYFFRVHTEASEKTFSIIKE
ncbi:MAG: T9SS type A sorting domain-containing protein [Saprospiraceae bacterium]|nr:T9SS type A sorting domain-containing protein [Saprospiraceae bacterium]